ncbi:MAG: S8 family serine peptidase, partial [Methylophilaceae bacterium]
GPATNISAFHSDPRFSNINGQGYSVVVIDTGIDLNHSYFGPDINNDGIADRIVYSYDFSGSNDVDATDGHGHGTHVAGIIGSSDDLYPGVAPEINLIVLKVFPDGQGSASQSDIQEALNWIVNHVDDYNIASVNISLGDSAFNTSASLNGYLASQFQSLANQGVVVVSASGNGYNTNSIQGVSYPSSDPYSLSVGAVWVSAGELGQQQVGVTDAIAVFSQRDDELSDIFAPGVFIESAKDGGGYVSLSGTSMASPEIAGMVALAQQLAEQELGRRLTFEEIHNLLSSTGDFIIDGDDENDFVPNTGLTFSRVNMLTLAETILGLKPPVSHSVEVTAGETVLNKDFGFSSTSSIQALSGDDVIFGTIYGEDLFGGAGADQISAGGGNDRIYGQEGNDRLLGQEADDLLEGGLGDDYLNGGNGIDIAIVNYLPSQYSFLGDELFSVEGSDTLEEIEYVGFGYNIGDAFAVDVDFIDLVDPDGAGEQSSVASNLLDTISDLYIAYFGRAPDAVGLSYWFKEIYTDSLSFDQTAQSFSDQAEYEANYPDGSTNRDFIEDIYANMFNRTPDVGGWDYWEAELNNGMPRDIFILAVINGAYAPTGGAQDSALLNNKHDVSMYYAEQSMLHPDEAFDDSIVELLNEVTSDANTASTAMDVIDFVFEDEITLTGVVNDAAIWDAYWA